MADRTNLLKQSRQYSDLYCPCRLGSWSVCLHGFFPSLPGSSSDEKTCTHLHNNYTQLILDIIQVKDIISTEIINRDHSFPWAAEFWAEPRNLLFCHGICQISGNTLQNVCFFSSIVPATRQKSNQYLISQAFIHASWPLLMSSLVICNIFYFCL